MVGVGRSGALRGGPASSLPASTRQGGSLSPEVLIPRRQKTMHLTPSNKTQRAMQTQYIQHLSLSLGFSQASALELESQDNLRRMREYLRHEDLRKPLALGGFRVLVRQHAGRAFLETPAEQTLQIKRFGQPACEDRGSARTEP
jgi:hypothetical protein